MAGQTWGQAGKANELGQQIGNTALAGDDPGAVQDDIETGIDGGIGSVQSGRGDAFGTGGRPVAYSSKNIAVGGGDIDAKMAQHGGNQISQSQEPMQHVDQSVTQSSLGTETGTGAHKDGPMEIQRDAPTYAQATIDENTVNRGNKQT